MDLIAVALIPRGGRPAGGAGWRRITHHKTSVGSLFMGHSWDREGTVGASFVPAKMSISLR